jgi:hypothetical protein
MVPHVDTHTVLVELDQRHRQAAVRRLVTACNPNQARPIGPVRWALGSVLLRAGALVVGDDRLLRSGAANGGSR